ncbi:hypothetical protein ACFLXC_00710 [Chloroflexota bacterium]
MRYLIVSLIILSLTLTGCVSPNITQNGKTPSVDVSPPTPPPTILTTLNKITLITGGYGYEVGEIVNIDTQLEPALGDIVQYDWKLNKSDCMGMGPSRALAKVIGKPGDKVSFELHSFSANGYTGSFPYGPDISPRTKPVMWGTVKYEDTADMELIVPDSEYLADSWVGLECTGEMESEHSSKTYNRFTVKREAIIGVIIEKLGHDKEFEERQKKIVY